MRIDRVRGQGGQGREWRVLVPLAALLAGLLFATTATLAHGSDLRASGRDDLRDLVERQQNTLQTQTRELAELQRRVQQLTADEATRDSGVASERDRAAALAAPAGLTAVHGPTLTVTLDDAPRVPAAQRPAGAAPDDLVVHQQDVQVVVNALWTGGAEAMMLMDQRVIATSAVRCVGNTLLLQGVVYSPPYVITAIGNVDRMRAALDTAPDVAIYRQYVDAYGLGYSVARSADLTLPAYKGPLTLQHAVVPLASPSGGS